MRGLLLDALAGIAVRIDYPEAFEDGPDIVVSPGKAGECIFNTVAGLEEAGAAGPDIVVSPGEAEVKSSDIVVSPGEAEGDGFDNVSGPGEAKADSIETVVSPGEAGAADPETVVSPGEAKADSPDIVVTLKKAGELLAGLLDGAEAGRIVRDGVRVAIVGKPNTGKSSLFNALSREDAAIVTATPGTTRDALEIWLDIRGVPVLLTDTAGIREDAGEIESLGIERAMEQYHKSDASVLVLDGSSILSEEDSAAAMRLDPGKPLIVAINKEDLPQAFDREEAAGLLPFPCGAENITHISLVGDGRCASVEKLEALLEKTVLGGDCAGSSLLVTKARHKALLETATEEIAEAMDVIDRGEAPEFAEVNIRAAWNALGEITGETAADDVIDRVFEEFCVGK